MNNKDKMSKRIAVITGAAGGIGREFTKEMIKEAESGYIDEIWAIGRSISKLDGLKKDFGDMIIPVVMDISNTDELEAFAKQLEAEKPQVIYLINNAGIARLGESCEFSLKEIEDTININCKAPVMLINICRPYMSRGSHILNISSASAFQPNPYINLYASTKAFEKSYSNALSVELKEHGIVVTAVCPSWVDTPLIPKEKNGKNIKYPGIISPETVARQAVKDTKRGRDMSFCSAYVRGQYFNVKHMPRKICTRIWMRWLRKYE